MKKIPLLSKESCRSEKKTVEANGNLFNELSRVPCLNKEANGKGKKAD